MCRLSPLKVWIISSLILDVCAQVRLVCPRPQSPVSNLTEGPCGQNSFNSDFLDDFTTVSPGALTIHWEYTIPSTGRPSRISLGEWGQKDPCVLVDRIPHNSNDTFTNSPDCKGGHYPIGSCQRTGTYLTVQIPNINCSRCYIQLASYVTDGKPCAVDDNEPANSNCTVFYSCANIRISPSTIGRIDTGSCKDAITSPAAWPFPPSNIYKGNTTGTFLDGHNVMIEFTEIVDGSDALSTIHYRIDFQQVLLPVVIRASFHFRLNNDLPAQFLQLRQEEQYGFYAGTIPFPIKGLLRSSLHETKWFLRLIFQPSPIYRSDHLDIYLVKTGQVYEDLVAPYSTGGWLRGERFIGPNASLSSFVIPAGMCAVEAESFGSVMYDTIDESIRAVLTYSLFEEVLFLKGAFSSTLSDKWTLELQSHIRLGAKIIFEPQMTGNIVDVSLDLSQFIQSGGGYPPYKFEARSQLGLEKLILRAVEKDKRAVATALYDSSGFIVGNAILTFMETSWSLTTLLINPGNRFPIAPEVSLRGPITPGFQGALLHTISGSIFDNGMELGGWILQTTYSKTDTIFQQYLWIGKLNIVLVSGMFTLKGTFQRVTERFCNEVPTSFICKVTLLEQAEIPDRLGPLPPISGLVTFGLNEKTDTLTYSVTIHCVRENETVSEALFERAGQQVGFNSSQGFRKAFWNDRTLVSTGTILLSPDLYEGLSSGDIYVGIHTVRPIKGQTNSNSTTDMQGVLPDFQHFLSTTHNPVIPLATTSAPMELTTSHKDVATCTTLDYARENIFLARVHLCW